MIALEYMFLAVFMTILLPSATNPREIQSLLKFFRVLQTTEHSLSACEGALGVQLGCEEIIESISCSHFHISVSEGGVLDLRSIKLHYNVDIHKGIA